MAKVTPPPSLFILNPFPNISMGLEKRKEFFAEIFDD